jgi:outer membrane protein with beta-barrel domain
MNRASLAVILTVLLIAFSTTAGAADPPAGGSSVDPFAPTPEGKAPTPEDQEAAVLGAPDRPSPPPPTTPAPPPRRQAASPRARQANEADDEARPAAVKKESDQSGIAIELSTAGFASGSLGGGLFLGGRMASGVIIGGFLDYGLTSLESTPPSGAAVTTSEQLLRLGAGVRHTFAQSADRRVDVYGAADVGFEYRSAEVPSTSGTTPTENMSASGFSLALGPGLRLWVHEQVAIGYVARLRMTYLSGAAGRLTTPQTNDAIDATLTQVGFDGTFQLLGVF